MPRSIKLEKKLERFIKKILLIEVKGKNSRRNLYFNTKINLTDIFVQRKTLED